MCLLPAGICRAQAAAAGREKTVNSGLPGHERAFIRMNRRFSIDGAANNHPAPDLLKRAPAGAVCAVNRAHGRIRMWNREGEFAGYIGRRGTHSGQYRFIKDVASRQDGSFVLLESYAGKTMILYTDGRAPAGFLWALPFDRYQDRIILAAESLYVAVIRETMIGKTRPLAADVAAFSYTGEKLWEISGLADGAVKVEHMDARQNSISLQPHALSVSVCGDPRKNELHVICGHTFLIRTYDLQGRLIRESSRPYERVRVSPRSEGLRDNAPSADPEFKNVAAFSLVDDESRLWVRTWETRAGLTAYDVFSAKGVYLYRFWLDVHPLLFQGSCFYTLSETGEITCMEYSVIHSE